MVRALATAVVAAVVCAVLSCWLVLIGWSLMGDAVSHAVLPGVVLAYVVGAPFAVGAIVFGFLAVALIGAIRTTSRIKEDAAIGIVFTTLFALGLVLISVTPSQTDLNHIIFGNLLGVSGGDLHPGAADRGVRAGRSWWSSAATSRSTRSIPRTRTPSGSTRGCWAPRCSGCWR